MYTKTDNDSGTGTARGNKTDTAGGRRDNTPASSGTGKPIIPENDVEDIPDSNGRQECVQRNQQIRKGQSAIQKADQPL